VANPQVVISVTLNATSHGDAGFGGVVAAPVFREVATHALRMLDVPKDLPGDAPTSVTAVSKDEPTNMNDLPVAGLGLAPQPLLTAAISNSAHNNRVARDRSVSSVTPPPVQAKSPVSAGDSALDRRHFLNGSGEASNGYARDSSPGLVASAGLGSKTPDFRGMTLRAVLEESAAQGLPVVVQGSGLARNQEPPPGAPLRPRAPIHVQFGR
jgi:cell division protein FtsI (penicillin-binding protein 3)